MPPSTTPAPIPQQPPQRRLGKRRHRRDPRTLSLGRYLVARQLPPPPREVRYSKKVEQAHAACGTAWPMYRNDDIGCCAIVGPAHQYRCWTANSGDPSFSPTLAQVLQEYRTVSGWDGVPGSSSDQGCVMLDVLKHWRTYGIAGRKIKAFALVERGDREIVKQAIHLFGGVLLGLGLPLAAESMDTWLAPTNPRHWRGDWAPWSWGGHCVYAMDYDDAGLLCATWGAPKRLSWNFFAAYCDEAWAALDESWINDLTAACPNGFDVDTLASDLRSVERRAA